MRFEPQAGQASGAAASFPSQSQSRHKRAGGAGFSTIRMIFWPKGKHYGSIYSRSERRPDMAAKPIRA